MLILFTNYSTTSFSQQSGLTSTKLNTSYQDQEGKNKDEENKTKFNKKAGTYASQFTDWSTQLTRLNAIGATQFSRARQEQQRSCPGSRSEHFLLRDWEDGQRCQ